MEGMKKEAKIVGLVAGLGALVGAGVVYQFGASPIVALLLATLALVGLTVLRRQGLDFLAMMAAVVLTAYYLTQNVYVAVVAAVIVLLVGFFGRQALQQQPARQAMGQQQSDEGDEEGGVNVQTTVKGLNRGLVDPELMKSLVDRGGTTGKLADLVLQAELAGMAVRRGVNPVVVSQILSGDEVQQAQGQSAQVPKLERGRAKSLFRGGK